jgi:creatinine amidohydrolase
MRSGDSSREEFTCDVSCSSLVLPLAMATLTPAQQKLPTHWEELTADEFRHAIEQSKGTCVLPFGILEKHGPHLPLGTDLINVRYASLHAAEQEYAIVFPEYYFGQIFEAKHEPGTMAYSRDLELKLLQETTDEMARNGCKKIIIVNGHGGMKACCRSSLSRSSKSLTTMWFTSSGAPTRSRTTL